MRCCREDIRLKGNEKQPLCDRGHSAFRAKGIVKRGSTDEHLETAREAWVEKLADFDWRKYDKLDPV
jgi:hypothetical protein